MSMTLKCQRCLHLWKYKGKKRFVTSCSSCKTSVYFKKNMIPSDYPIPQSPSQIESEIRSNKGTDAKDHINPISYERSRD